jgi:mRNA interferase MazF
MGKFIKGDVVVIPFPYSDLSNTKKRPSLVLSDLKGDDVILCQITSKSVNDEYSISLFNSDFENGMLNQDSNIRPNRLFTADQSIILYKIGSIKNEKYDSVIKEIVNIMTK